MFDFTEEEVKHIPTFQPQQAKTYLNNLLKEKLRRALKHIEIAWSIQPCAHPHEKVRWAEVLVPYKATPETGFRCIDCGTWLEVRER